MLFDKLRISFHFFTYASPPQRRFKRRKRVRAEQLLHTQEIFSPSVGGNRRLYHLSRFVIFIHLPKGSNGDFRPLTAVIHVDLGIDEIRRHRKTVIAKKAKGFPVPFSVL